MNSFFKQKYYKQCLKENSEEFHFIDLRSCFFLCKKINIHSDAAKKKTTVCSICVATIATTIVSLYGVNLIDNSIWFASRIRHYYFLLTVNTQQQTKH